MAPREDNNESSRGPGPAEADAVTGDAATRKLEEQALEANETAARATAGVDEYPAADDDEYYDADHVILNLNRMRRLNLMKPEWIEEMRRDHLGHVAIFIKDLSDDEGDDEFTDDADFDEFCKNILKNVDLSGLNPADGESCGMYGGKSGSGFWHGDDKHDAAEESSS